MLRLGRRWLRCRVTLLDKTLAPMRRQVPVMIHHEGTKDTKRPFVSFVPSW